MNFDLALTLAIAAVQFAATFGGVLAAIKFLGQGITEAKHNARRAHERLDTHLHQHMEGKL